MLNQFGRVACTAAGTIYLQRGRVLLTPPLSEGALPGIIRGGFAAWRIGRSDLPEALIEPDMLRTADALFVSNSLIGVVPAHMQGGSDITEGKKNRALLYAPPCQNSQSADLVFRLQHLPTTIHTAFQIDMVATVQFPAIRIFDIIRGAQQRVG